MAVQTLPTLPLPIPHQRADKTLLHAQSLLEKLADSQPGDRTFQKSIQDRLRDSSSRAKHVIDAQESAGASVDSALKTKDSRAHLDSDKTTSTIHDASAVEDADVQSQDQSADAEVDSVQQVEQADQAVANDVDENTDVDAQVQREIPLETDEASEDVSEQTNVVVNFVEGGKVQIEPEADAQPKPADQPKPDQNAQDDQETQLSIIGNHDQTDVDCACVDHQDESGELRQRGGKHVLTGSSQGAQRSEEGRSTRSEAQSFTDEQQIAQRAPVLRPTIEAIVPRTAERVIQAKLFREGWASEILKTPVRINGNAANFGQLGSAVSSVAVSTRLEIAGEHAAGSVPVQSAWHQQPKPSAEIAVSAELNGRLQSGHHNDSQSRTADSQVINDGVSRTTTTNPLLTGASPNNASQAAAEESDATARQVNSTQRTAEPNRSSSAESVAGKASGVDVDKSSSQSHRSVKSVSGIQQADSGKQHGSVQDPLALLNKIAQQAIARNADQKSTTLVEGRSGGSQVRQHSANDAQNSPFNAQLRSLGSQAVRGVAAALASEDRSITLKLEPASLGEMRVKIELKEGAVSARFEVSSSEARRLLDQSSSHLRRALEARGLAVESFDVRVADVPSGSHDVGHQSPGTGGDLSQNAEAFTQSQDGHGFNHNAQGREFRHSDAQIRFQRNGQASVDLPAEPRDQAPTQWRDSRLLIDAVV